MILLVYSALFGLLGLRVGRSAWQALPELDPPGSPNVTPIIVDYDKTPRAKGVRLGDDRRCH